MRRNNLIMFMAGGFLLSLAVLAVAAVTQETNPVYLNVSAGVNNFINYTVTNFNDSSLSPTINGSTETGVWSKILYVDIPKNSTVLSGTLNITGLRYSTKKLFSLDDTNIFDDTFINRFSTTQENYTYGSNIWNEITVTRDSYYKFNISGFSRQDLLNLDANFTLIALKQWTLDPGEELNLTVYHIYQYPRFNITDLDWNEGTGTNQIDGEGDCSTSGQPDLCARTRPINSVQFNLTGESSCTVTDVPTNCTWNISKMFDVATTNGDINLTIMINASVLSGSPMSTDRATYFTKDNIASSGKILLKVSYTVNTSTYPTGVDVDVGDDGDSEFTDVGPVSGPNITTDFASEINDYLATCTADDNGLCQVPIKFTSTAGKLNVNALHITLNYNITYLFNLSGVEWDENAEIAADNIINKTRTFNTTLQNASLNVNISGLYVDGSECQVNDTSYTVSGGVCQYAFNVSQGSRFPEFEFYDSTFGNGTPIQRVNGSWSTGTYNMSAEVSINFSNVDGSAAGAGAFTNSSFGTICTNTSIIAGTELIRYVNSTGQKVDVTPENESAFERKAAGSDASDIVWVKKEDLCYSDGVLDFVLKVESNPA